MKKQSEIFLHFRWWFDEFVAVVYSARFVRNPSFPLWFVPFVFDPSCCCYRCRIVNLLGWNLSSHACWLHRFFELRLRSDFPRMQFGFERGLWLCFYIWIRFSYFFRFIVRSLKRCFHLWIGSGLSCWKTDFEQTCVFDYRFLHRLIKPCCLLFRFFGGHVVSGSRSRCCLLLFASFGWTVNEHSSNLAPCLKPVHSYMTLFLRTHSETTMKNSLDSDLPSWSQFLSSQRLDPLQSASA